MAEQDRLTAEEDNLFINLVDLFPFQGDVRERFFWEASWFLELVTLLLLAMVVAKHAEVDGDGGDDGDDGDGKVILY